MLSFVGGGRQVRNNMRTHLECSQLCVEIVRGCGVDLSVLGFPAREMCVSLMKPDCRARLPVAPSLFDLACELLNLEGL